MQFLEQSGTGRSDAQGPAVDNCSVVDQSGSADRAMPFAGQGCTFLRPLSTDACYTAAACRFSIGRRYSPVKLRLFAATISGVPSATISPPLTPPSGPRSKIQSAVLIILRQAQDRPVVFDHLVKLGAGAALFLQLGEVVRIDAGHAGLEDAVLGHWGCSLGLAFLALARGCAKNYSKAVRRTSALPLDGGGIPQLGAARLAQVGWGCALVRAQRLGRDHPHPTAPRLVPCQGCVSFPHQGGSE